MQYTAGSRTQDCRFFFSLSYHAKPPTPGGAAKDQGDSNLKPRGSEPRGRGRKRCVNPPFVTRCCPMPVPHPTGLVFLGLTFVSIVFAILFFPVPAVPDFFVSPLEFVDSYYGGP